MGVFDDLMKSAAVGTDAEYKNNYAKFIGKNSARDLTSEEIRKANDEKRSLAASYRSSRNTTTTSSSGDYRFESPTDAGSYAKDILFKSSLSKSSVSQLGDNDKVSAEKFRDAMVNPAKMGILLAKEIGLQLEREAQLRTDINEKIGVTGTLSETVQRTILESESTALRFGYNMNDISKMYISMADSSGRFNFMSSETLDKSYGTARAFVGTLDDLGKLMGEFEKIGLGSDDTIESINRTGRSSLSLGLNSKKTTELLKQDIGKLNEYGFKNGIDGLNRMVQKSLEFRMSMKEVFTIADKVMNPEGAIELAANLQVLGGAIGAFNDPMQMMYMATNNVEGLQDSLIGAASTLATFNTEQGKFEITGVNLRRAKEMAAQMGISYQELAKGAIAANERLEVTQALAAKGFNLDKGDEEFIANLSQMKGGEMVLSLPQDVANKIGVAVDTPITNLTMGQIAALKANKDALEKMNPERIAEEQFSKIVNLDRNVEAIANRFVKSNAATAKKEGVGGADELLLRGFENFRSLYEKGKDTGTTLQSAMNLAEQGFATTLQTVGIRSGLAGVLMNQLRAMMQSTAMNIEQERLKQEKEKKAEEGRPKNEDLSYGKTVNTKIDVTFPFGFGIPMAEVQGSYLT